MVRRIRKKQYKRRKKRQRGGFLNQYDFAYAGRDTVNQAMKGLYALDNKVDQIAQRHIYIQQIINQRGQQVEKSAPN